MRSTHQVLPPFFHTLNFTAYACGLEKPTLRPEWAHLGDTQVSQRNAKTMQRQCDDFNARYLVGQSIKFWTGPREGSPTHEGVIRFPAEILGGHTPVVYVEGKGSVARSHVGGPA